MSLAHPFNDRHECLSHHTSVLHSMNGVGIQLKRQRSFGVAKGAVEAPLRRVFGLSVPWAAVQGRHSRAEFALLTREIKRVGTGD